MAIQVMQNAVVTINGVDLSDHIESVELNYEAADVKTTNFGSNGSETRTYGLKSGSVTIAYQQDYASGKVDQTLFSLVGAAPVAITVKASSAATSATNPIYSGTFLVNQYKPVPGNKVGELATFSSTYPLSGALTRATA